MSVWRFSSTGCYSPRAWPGALLQSPLLLRLAPIFAAAALFAPTLFASPGSSVPAVPSAAVQSVLRLEVLVVADGWVLRLAEPLRTGWSPPLDEDAARRVGPGQAYVPGGSSASERVLLATAADLLGGRPGLIQLRGGDRVPWRALVRSAEVLGPLRLADEGDALAGVLVDARP